MCGSRTPALALALTLTVTLSLAVGLGLGLALTSWELVRHLQGVRARLEETRLNTLCRDTARVRGWSYGYGQG